MFVLRKHLNFIIKWRSKAQHQCCMINRIFKKYHLTRAVSLNQSLLSRAKPLHRGMPSFFLHLHSFPRNLKESARRCLRLSCASSWLDVSFIFSPIIIRYILLFLLFFLVRVCIKEGINGSHFFLQRIFTLWRNAFCFLILLLLLLIYLRVVSKNIKKINENFMKTFSCHFWS